MNKMLKNILIIIGMVVIIAVANLLLKNSIENSEPPKSTHEVDILYVSNFSAGPVESIKIENEYGELELVIHDGIWFAKGKEGIELDQEVVAELAYMLTHILGQRQVSDTIDTENIYGMQNPSAIITTYHQGVIEQKYIMGDASPIANEYYIQSLIFNKVFTVDMAYYIYAQSQIMDLMTLNEMHIEHEKLEKIDISNAKGENFTIAKTAVDNDITLCYWEFIYPFSHDIDTAVMYGNDTYRGIITYMSEVSGERVIGMIEEDSEAYGLDNPIYTAKIYSNDGTPQTFVIGDYSDEKSYSLTFNDDSSIYTISKERVPFVEYSVYMMCDANLALVNINTVDKVVVDIPNLQTTMNINHSIRKNDDGTNALDASGNPIVDAKILVDGLDESKANAGDMKNQKIWFYQDIVTIKIDDVIFDYSIDKSVGSIVFELNSSYKSNITINLYEYSQAHYLAIIDGDDKAGYLVGKVAIEWLSQRYELLLHGLLQSTY